MVRRLTSINITQYYPSVRKSKPGPINFSYAIKSFMGYLEGTQKSAHTIKNYRLDILAFERFIVTRLGSRLTDVGPADLEAFQNHLKEQGLKTNTRRRKILTVRKFLQYLSNRKKLAPELGKKVPAPHKIERIPLTVSTPTLLDAVRKLSHETVLDARNRAMLWILAETGCLVSELSPLRWVHFTMPTRTTASVRIEGKSARVIQISMELFEAVREISEKSGPVPGALFQGFNKFGSMGAPITSRGVELLVKTLAPRLGFPELTPRTFRHSATIHWFEQGINRREIQERLGLKTDYAFRAYEPLFKSSLKATSTSGTSPSES